MSDRHRRPIPDLLKILSPTEGLGSGGLGTFGFRSYFRVQGFGVTLGFGVEELLSGLSGCRA